MRILYVVTFLRLALGGLWLVSGGLKLLQLDAFVRDVRNYQFPGFDVAPGDMMLGYGLPWLELMVGVLLTFGLWKRCCYALSAVLFAMFLVAISYAKYHGLQIHCGCFGSGEDLISYWHFVGLSAGLMGTLWLLRIDHQKPSEVTEGEVAEV